MPLAIAAYVSRTGRLLDGYLASSANLAGLAAFIALYTGGLGSFALAWLVAVPAEAALSGSRRVVLAGLVIACLAVAAIAYADFGALLPASRVPGGSAEAYMAAATLVAAVYVGGIALGVHRFHTMTADALRHSESRYRLLAQNASDLITRHDGEGNVTFASGATASLAGVLPEQLQGDGLLARVHPEDRALVLSTLTAANDGGKPATVEFRLRRDRESAGRDDSATGAVIWVEMRCKRVETPETERAVVAVTRDVSERKARQVELRQARDDAERANRAKTFFLANMSHELRTPLNAIIGFSEILQEDLARQSASPQSREYAELIYQSGAHLLHVVNDLLDMSKIEAGKFELFHDSFDMREVIGVCERVMGPVAQSADVSLANDLPRDDLSIVADRRACKQMLLNLLSNAIKFSREGGTVEISAWQEGEGICVREADTGVGIPDSVIPRLGTPFTQGDVAYSRSHEGTGLGLSVVRGLVRLHGGRFEIESEVDVGTRVTIWLPLDCRHIVGDDAEHGDDDGTARDAKRAAMYQTA